MSIILENVSFSYSRKTPLETPALREINLRIEKGEFVGVLGEKGAGKSTFLKLFNGLLIPDTGTVRVNGHNPSSREARHIVSMVFQQPADQLFCRTIFDEIAFICKHPKTGKQMDEVGKNYRAAKVKSHLIFYKVENDIVQIVRILHERMDIKNRLDD